MNTLLDLIHAAARTAFGVFAIVVFCVTCATAIAWAMIMGRPSPFGKEEDAE